MTETRSFIYQADNSNKFWKITLEGNSVITHWGRSGTKGQTKSFPFSSDVAAADDFAKRIAGKIKEGYTEISSPVTEHLTLSPLPEGDTLAALQALGIDPQQLASPSGDDDRNLTSLIADSEFSVITDWRDPVVEVLGQFEKQLLRYNVRLQLSDDEAAVVKLTADQSAVRFQLSNLEDDDVNLYEVVFALDSMLPASLEIYSLAECDDSDGYVYLLLFVETWDRLKQILGSHFSQYFAKHPAMKVKKLPAPKSAPRVAQKKMNWQKEYDYGRREPSSDEETPIRLDRYLDVVEAIDPRCPTPIIRHARTPSCPYNQRIADAFQRTLKQPTNGGSVAILTPSELLDWFAKDLNDAHSDPWLVHGQTEQLATLLYEHAYAILVATSYAFVCAHYRPVASCSFSPLGMGDPTWSYFVFLALGCQDEARRLGDLLMQPAAQTAERAPWEKNREAYCDLAVLLHRGDKGRHLGMIDPIVALTKPAAWDDPENILRALQYHCIKRGESFTHNYRRWVWPAPIYALARQCNARDKLPMDNPFLNQWRDESDIDQSSELIRRLREVDQRLSSFTTPSYPPLMPVPPITIPARVATVENERVMGATVFQSVPGYEFVVKGSPKSAQAPRVGELWNFKMTSTGSTYVAEKHPDLGDIHYEKYRLEGSWLNRLPDDGTSRSVG